MAFILSKIKKKSSLIFSKNNYPRQQRYMNQKKNVVLDGLLFKWTNYIYRWQPRFCCIKSDGTFSYGKISKTPKMTLPISECRFATVKNNPYRFILYFEKKRISLRATDSSLASKWLSTLRVERNKQIGDKTPLDTSSLVKAEARVTQGLVALQKKLNGEAQRELNELKSALVQLKSTYGGHQAKAPEEWKPSASVLIREEHPVAVETELIETNKGLGNSILTTFISPAHLEEKNKGDKHFRFLDEEEENEAEEELENYSFDFEEEEIDCPEEENRMNQEEIQGNLEDQPWPRCLHPLKQVRLSPDCLTRRGME